MKKVHIIVEGGLVQRVYADKDLDVEVVLYDLDTDNNEEYDTLITALTEVRKSGANMVY